MDNYKINRNKPDLPEERINKHKDFGKLLENHQKILKYKDATKPLYKNTKFMGLIVILSVVLLVFIITERENEQKNNKDKSNKNAIEKNNTAKSDSLIKNTETVSENETPFTIIYADQDKRDNKPKLAFHSYSVKANEGTIIYNKDARIIVPANAFADKNGNLIKDNVRLDFRTFKDPADFFLANIPMSIETSSGKQHLQSAGMFELRGFYGNQEAQIKTPITVELTTPSHSGYNHYYYNEKEKKWQELGKEKASVRFMIQGSETDFPELTPFKNVVWELAVTDPRAYNFVFTQTWSKITLSDNESLAQGVSLQSEKAKPKFLARPVALSNDLSLSTEMISAMFDQYDELVKRKETEATESKLAQEKWMKSPEGQAYLKWASSPEGKRSMLNGKLVNTFTVSNFGIYNCDTPKNLLSGGKVIPTFVDEKGKKLNTDNVYLVDYSVNTVYTYYKDEKISYNPKSSNVLWAALPDGKLAIYEKEDFKAIQENEHTFKMKVKDINGKSIEEVKAMLGMENHAVSIEEEKEKNKAVAFERVIQMKNDDAIRLAAEAKRKADEETKRLAEEAKKKAADSLKKDILDKLKTNEKVSNGKDIITKNNKADNKPASFPGGDKAMYQFLNMNTDIPYDIIEGNMGNEKIMISFTVNKDGTISNIIVGKSPYKDCPDCTKKILNSLTKMPKWNAATEKGKPVSTNVTIPLALIPGSEN